MKGYSGWHYRPYRPFHRADEALAPFVCRLSPSLTGVELEWFDRGWNGGHHVLFRRRNSGDPWTSRTADDCVVRIDGLEGHTDYELFVERCGHDGSSAIRIVHTCDAPGVTVNYLHPDDALYAFSGHALCSPSIVRLPSGALLASMDLYGPGQPQNLTLLFRSDDGGASWRYVTDLFPCYWGTLFLHRGELYMLATSTEYGDLLIGRSDDEGRTWTAPTVILRGSGSRLASGWQHTPTPIIEHEGRLCTSIDYGAWAEGGHGICLLSCGADADLLDGAAWSVTPPRFYSPDWPGAPAGNSRGLLEGSVVAAPDGTLTDLLRLQIDKCTPSHGLAVALKMSGWETAPEFAGFVDMPTGSNSKTHVLWDGVSRRYLGVGNLCVDPQTPAQRNVMALESSPDLVHWQVNRILLDYRHMNPADVGFQYMSFVIDGDDLLILSRTAIHGARNYHDANFQTFHRVENFRQYLGE